MYIIKCI